MLACEVDVLHELSAYTFFVQSAWTADNQTKMYKSAQPTLGRFSEDNNDDDDDDDIVDDTMRISCGAAYCEGMLLRVSG